MATIFSRIVAGEIPSYKIAEDDRYYAFLDINPLAKGHTLVIPKQEVDYFYDLDDDTLQGMILFAKQVAQKLQAFSGCKKVATVVLGLEVAQPRLHRASLQGGVRARRSYSRGYPLRPLLRYRYNWSLR